MEFIRLPRFKRSSAAPSIELTNRDHQIIQNVCQYRFLRSLQIVALIGDPAQQLLRRLQLLYHHGYLERPRAQLDYYHHSGSRPIVYGLGNKGARLLKESGSAVATLRWSEKNHTVGRIFLEHALLVSEIMVAIELSCRKRGNVRLVTGPELFQDTGNKKLPSYRWSVNLGSGICLGVIPDQVFGLEFYDTDGKTTRAFFFLEADRGTMPVIRHNLAQTSFYRKLLAYEATWAQSIHQSHFGFHRFRVLTVTKSSERVRIIVDACGKLKTGHGLFLFSDQNILKTPADILSTAWQTGRTGNVSSLLD